MTLKERTVQFLRWSQQYTGTDMVYLATGLFWINLGKAGVLLVSFLTLFAFANWLPKENYGTYQFIIGALGILTIFTLPGLSVAIVRGIARGKEGTLFAGMRERIRWGTVGSLIAAGIALWYLIQGNDQLSTAFLLVAIFMPFKETLPMFADFWIAKKRFHVQAKYTILSALLSSFIILPTIYLTDNVLAILAVFLASQTFFDFIFYMLTKRSVQNTDTDEGTIAFGKNFSVMNAAETIAIHIDKVIIWKLLGPVAVAVYAFAQLPIQKITQFIPISTLALPKLGEASIAEKKHSILSKFYKLFVVTIPLALILIVIAPFLYKTVFPQYIESVVYFQAFSLLIVLMPFMLLFYTLVSDLRTKELYVIQIGSPFLKIILLIILVSSFGLWGAVTAILAVETMKGIALFYYFQKI